MSLVERLLKNSTIKATSLINESKVFGKKEMIPTTVPMVNVALSGRVDGGLLPGVTVLAGPSKHFKTAFALLMAKAFQDKYPDGVILFYDSEFGTPQDYFSSFGIDMDRVVHTPIMNIEELKFEATTQLEALTKKDKVMIVIDSVGNLASKKEVDDALEQKSSADMTRAKQLKSVFRIITPHLSTKDIPLVAVNHTYKTQEMYSKDVVSGGTGIYYSADTIWILGRQQEKEGTEVAGYNFIIRVEKSRHVKENSKIPITVTFKGGIDRYSGIFDLALDSGHVVKATQGWYSLVDQETGEVSDKKLRKADIEKDKALLRSFIEDPKFQAFIEERYKLATTSIMKEDNEDAVSDEHNDEDFE